jgi:integrase/recombinase XerD
MLSAALARIIASHPSAKNNARRLHALILLLRYSGLRIGDAVGCERNRLVDGRLRLYTQKTGTHIHVPLPDFVVAALREMPPMSERYWFWTGNGKLQTAVADWQGRLLSLASDARVSNLHAHRFRDSFAVALLLEGVPIERVSILLGHTSTRITERHYSPWVRERQEQAEADVRRTWKRDPVALLETKGTPEVHGKRDVPN